MTEPPRPSPRAACVQNLEEVAMLEVRVDATMICIDPIAEVSAACIPTVSLRHTLDSGL
jgi:hypothetical protein